MAATAHEGIGVAPSLLLIFAVTASRSVAPTPAVLSRSPAPLSATLKGQKVAVTLAPALRRAIITHYPGYSLAVAEFAESIKAEGVKEGLYFACVGDFDGNRLTDAALYLIERQSDRKDHRRTWLLVAFHQMDHRTFRPYVLDTGYDPGFGLNAGGGRYRLSDDMVTTTPRGSRVSYSLPGSKTVRMLRLQHDGITEWTNDGEAAEVFYFRQGRYRSVDTVGDE
jgi:hypothetical protein